MYTYIHDMYVYMCIYIYIYTYVCIHDVSLSKRESRDHWPREGESQQGDAPKVTFNEVTRKLPTCLFACTWGFVMIAPAIQSEQPLMYGLTSRLPEG